MVILFKKSNTKICVTKSYVVANILWTKERDMASPHIHNNLINPKSRELWIHSINSETSEDIDYAASIQTIKHLHLLRQESDHPAIIHLYASGGSYDDSITLYDVIKSMPYKITIVGYGGICSASSFIMQAGDERLMLPHAYMLIHYGTTQMPADYKTNQSWSQFMVTQTQDMLKIYAEQMLKCGTFKNTDINKIIKFLKNKIDVNGDVFFTAEQSLELGLIDGIIDSWPSRNDKKVANKRKKE